MKMFKEILMSSTLKKDLNEIFNMYHLEIRDSYIEEWILLDTDQNGRLRACLKIKCKKEYGHC